MAILVDFFLKIQSNFRLTPPVVDLLISCKSCLPGLASEADASRVGLEPILGFTVVRADALDFRPEASGVIELPQMHQFVDDDVITHHGGY